MQLADDLQDVRQDRQDGVLTLFSKAADEGPLDELTSRVLQFAQKIAQQMQRLPSPDCQALKELVQKSSGSLLIRSAGEAGELYSQDYLAELETHSPFRFSFLSRQRDRLARRQGTPREALRGVPGGRRGRARLSFASEFAHAAVLSGCKSRRPELV